MHKKDIKNLSLLAITWPIFIELLLHMLMGNLDSLMLSQYSDQAVAAVGVSNQVLSLMIVLFGFVSTGTAILVAQNLGAGKPNVAGEIAVVSTVTNLVFGGLISLVLIIFGKPILHLMGISNELMGDAQLYLNIVGGFIFVEALTMTFGATVRSYGFTRDSMNITILMNVIHVVLNYCFIFGPFGLPVLGVKGVAISTAVSRLIGLIIMIAVLFYRVPQKLPFSQFFKLPTYHYRNLLRIGIPAAGEQLSYNGSQMVITSIVASFGTEALTTKIYAQNLMMFIYLFSVAISEGTQILIGHLVGSGRLMDAYHRCLRSFRLAFCFSLGMALIVSIFNKPLLGIFTHNHDIIATGSILIWLTVLLEPGRTFNSVIISSLRAAGDVRFPVYMAIISMWGVSVTISYVAGVTFGLGLIGIWISFIADEWLRGILMLRRWRSKKWMETNLMRIRSKKESPVKRLLKISNK